MDNYAFIDNFFLDQSEIKNVQEYSSKILLKIILLDFYSNYGQQFINRTSNLYLIYYVGNLFQRKNVVFIEIKISNMLAKISLFEYIPMRYQPIVQGEADCSGLRDYLKKFVV